MCHFASLLDPGSCGRATDLKDHLEVCQSQANKGVSYAGKSRTGDSFFVDYAVHTPGRGLKARCYSSGPSQLYRAQKLIPTNERAISLTL